MPIALKWEIKPTTYKRTNKAFTTTNTIDAIPSSITTTQKTDTILEDVQSRRYALVVWLCLFGWMIYVLSACFLETIYLLSTPNDRPYRRNLVECSF